MRQGVLSAFSCFFTQAMLLCMTERTNEYAISSMLVKGTAAVTDWQPVTPAEMESFIGAHFSMDIDIRPHLDHYWYTGTNPVLNPSGGHHPPTGSSTHPALARPSACWPRLFVSLPAPLPP